MRSCSRQALNQAAGILQTVADLSFNAYVLSLLPGNASFKQKLGERSNASYPADDGPFFDDPASVTISRAPEASIIAAERSSIPSSVMKIET